MPGFLLDQTFFIPTSNYRKQLHDDIFELIWYGQGRWDWSTVYYMPIWMRKFYFKKINEKIQPTPDKPKPKKETIAKPPF